MYFLLCCYLVVSTSAWLPGKTRLRNDSLLCVEWDVKPYTLTQSFLFTDGFVNVMQWHDWWWLWALQHCLVRHGFSHKLVMDAKPLVIHWYTVPKYYRKKRRSCFQITDYSVVQTHCRYPRWFIKDDCDRPHAGHFC